MSVLSRSLPALLLGASFAFAHPALADTTLLNVSYDATRELYQKINAAFAPIWKAKSGQALTINQSHGGSGSQAQAVINGQEADVVTLAISYDIDAIAKTGQINANWATRLPQNSSPYTSTIVFLVRKGNPKQIKDWDDLVKPGVGIITPNPKTGGASRWAYLAAWGYELDKTHDKAKAADFVKGIYRNVTVLDASSRASTTTFTERGIGDVLLSWEDEADLAIKTFGADKYEIVNPSISILAEPPVTVVDKNVDKHHTRDAAEAYLKYLYAPEAQEVEAQNFFRPRDENVAKKYASSFPNIKLFTADSLGGWDALQKAHFADGALFDQIEAGLGKN